MFCEQLPPFALRITAILATSWLLFLCWLWNKYQKQEIHIYLELLTRKQVVMFGSSLAKSMGIQTVPYTKPLSPASDTEYFLHLSPFRSEFPAHFLLYTISPMPKLGIFRNKSLTTFALGLAALERLHSSGQNQATGVTTAHHALIEFQHVTDFNSLPSLPPHFRQPDIWLWLSGKWKSHNQLLSFFISIFISLFTFFPFRCLHPQKKPFPTNIVCLVGIYLFIGRSLK